MDAGHLIAKKEKLEMKTVSRIFLFGALTLVLLTAACTGQEGSPTPVEPTGPVEETSYPPPIETEVTEETATTSPEASATMEVTDTVPAATDTTQTPGVPGAGTELILLECQFCIDGAAHAMLVLPDTATFETVADTATLSTPGPDMGCNTVDTYNGRQVVICRGEEDTSLSLNICTDGNNCTQLLVELQTCPDVNPPGATNTPEAGLPTDTPGAGVPTDTPGVGVTDTPAVLPTNSPNAGGATATP
jgi:hypothetical protein